MAAEDLNSALVSLVRRSFGSRKADLHESLTNLVSDLDGRSSSKSSGPSSGDSSKESDRSSGTGLHSASLSADAAATRPDASLDKLDFSSQAYQSMETRRSLRPESISMRGRSSYISKG